MTYRDNDVYFSGVNGYSLVSVSFTVSSYSITSGQDPDGKIRSGYTFSGGSNGMLRFSIGRKASTTVASWFNARISGSQNTFNQTAGELNFAMTGTLRVTVRGGMLGGRQEMFTFPNVAIAQGSTGTSNNWWFGSQGSIYAQNNRIQFNGTNSRGWPVAFLARRGGNGVNTIDVSALFLLDTPNWMSRLNDSLRLDQVMMPGSHDAGMSELSHCAPLGAGTGITKTQSGSIAQQLIDGSRYFDIRVDYDYNELVTYHRTGALGCNGQSFRSVLDQTRAFLQAHSREVVIMKISHIRDYDGHNPADIKLKVEQMLQQYEDIIYKNSNVYMNLAQLNVGAARGKMIVVMDYGEFINPYYGRFLFTDGSSSANPGLTVYDMYSNTSDYTTMKNDQLQKWRMYGGTGKGYMFLLSWTLTGGAFTDSVENMANGANAELPQVLYDQIIGIYAGKPNIVYVDFLNSTVAQSIILFNF